MNPILDTLNDRQLEAVQLTEGPLLITAGAGSGKKPAVHARTGTRTRFLLASRLCGITARPSGGTAARRWYCRAAKAMFLSMNECSLVCAVVGNDVRAASAVAMSSRSGRVSVIRTGFGG